MKTVDISAVLTGAQLLLSMVETRRATRNGNSLDPSSPQELERVEQQIGRLEALEGQNDSVRQEIEDLRARVDALRRDMAHRAAWIKTELARHPQRPYFLDYVEKIFTDFSEIHGDRRYADDPAMICGMARFHGEEVLLIGTQKGRDTKQKVYRNFGDRKSTRLNSSHSQISYAVFCLKKKKTNNIDKRHENKTYTFLINSPIKSALIEIPNPADHK